MTKRGLTYAEAMAYVGVKRRQFDSQWRPRLVAMQQGVTLIFDRQDLDRLFDEFKALAAGETQAANDAQNDLPHNGQRNGRPDNTKGRKQWAIQQGESSPTEKAGKLTSGKENSAFANAVFQLSRKRIAG